MSRLLKNISEKKFRIEFVLENPIRAEMKPNIIYIVANGRVRKWACFLCPSDCGDQIMLSLIKGSQPSWKLTIKLGGKPTIYPSVRKLDGCKSHFWIRNGIVKWVDF